MSSPKPIIITPYSEQWPITFEQLKKVYKAALHNLVEGIEHVGSTSVPGLEAKPVIDIDIIISDATKLNAVIAKLEELGYQHAGDQGIAGREAFKRTSLQAPFNGSGKEWPHHHLYVCLQNSLGLINHLYFRDYLRTHPEAVQAYQKLKEDLAARYVTDINRYVEGKTAFIIEILSRLGVEQASLNLIKTQNEA